MRAKTLQIVWHGKEPVYSVDFCGPSCFATAGADKEVKIWKVSRDAEGYGTVQHVSSLSGHTRTVNCVRYSPSGDQLVSSGDGGEMLLWQAYGPDNPPPTRSSAFGEDPNAEVPTMRRVAVLRGHSDDIMDLSWSADGSALVSGSIDNSAVVWGVEEGKRRGSLLAQLAQHRHFVQGVAWDPLRRFVATQGADRTCRIYRLRPLPTGGKRKSKISTLSAAARAKDLYCCATLSKAVPGAAEAAGTERMALFQDETLPSFFRRLSWSPDGTMLAVPGGIYHWKEAGRQLHAVHLYARGRWSAPALHLAGQTKPVVATRWCPRLFCLPEDTPSQLDTIDLPYRMVLAVATLDTVFLYDTMSAAPLCALCALHYDSITDLAWSDDAQYLVVSSRDCYCSVIAFDEGELGRPVDDSEALKFLPTVGPHLRGKAAGAATAKQVDESAPGKPETVPEHNEPSQLADSKLLQPGDIKRQQEPSSSQPITSTKSRRIEPQRLSPGSVVTSTPFAAPVSNSEGEKQQNTEAEVVLAQQPAKRRVAPTPISMPQQTSFAIVTEVSGGSCASQPTSSTANATTALSRRRITPVPVGPAAQLPAVATPRE